MLAGWLSWPVVAGGLFAVPAAIVLSFSSPLAIALAFVPLLIVGPVLGWLDRVEPEPRQARVHAFLWGATISGVVAGTINSIVFAASSETWAAVVSAPITEEIMKTAGIVWALRRGEIDGVMDGVVYAGWVALGFAVVENFLYFAEADNQDLLWQTFVARALVTPFAHPLFTVWAGLAIGRAVARQVSVLFQLGWGLPFAVLSHAAWNGSLTLAEDDEVALIVAVPAFFALFVAAGLTVTIVRRNEQAHFVRLVPTIARRYGLNAEEVAIFGDWRSMLRTRRRLPRKRRAAFDAVHRNLARLAALHHRPGSFDSAAEAVLVNRLQRARAG